MNRLFLILAIAGTFMASEATAQRVYEDQVKDKNAVQREVYAQIRVRPRFLSNKVSIRLD